MIRKHNHAKMAEPTWKAEPLFNEEKPKRTSILQELKRCQKVCSRKPTKKTNNKKPTFTWECVPYDNISEAPYNGWFQHQETETKKTLVVAEKKNKCNGIYITENRAKIMVDNLMLVTTPI